MHFLHKAISLIAAMFLLFTPASALAVPLIRDAEIEDTLRAYGNPLFEAAGLSPSAIRIFIVSDPTVNAFVAGGANLFIHTGLILKTDRPEMLIGVMAHETGHIAGGHLAQGAESLKNAQLGSILSAILGVAAMASGNGSAGIAVMALGQETTMRNFLRFTRANESAADQAGLNYLDDLHISASGMLRMLELLRQDENRAYGARDPYTRTHPLNIDRITHIRNHVMRSDIPSGSVPKSFPERHARMLAKLRGFTQVPEQTFAAYPASDTSVPARYARAIAWFRTPDLSRALETMGGLIAEHPSDPFFHELKGQMLFENGRLPEAIESYSKAAELLPKSPLILTDYGRALLARGKPEDMQQAMRSLEKASLLDNSNITTWHNLAIAYAKNGKEGLYYLARAEEASLRDDPSEVLRDVDLALTSLSGDHPARLRAGDLKLLAQQTLDDRKAGRIPEKDE